MELFTSIVTAILGVVAAVIGRRKVIEHRFSAVTGSSYAPSKLDTSFRYRARKSLLLLIVATFALVLAEIAFKNDARLLGAALGSLVIFALFGVSIHFFIWFFSLFR